MAMQERPGHRVETLGSPTTSLETCEGGGGVCSTEREWTNKWGVLGEIPFYFQKIPSNSSRLDLTDFSYEQCDLKPCWLMISSGIILPNILGIYSNPIGESLETNQFLWYGGFHKWGSKKWLVYFMQKKPSRNGDWGYPCSRRPEHMVWGFPKSWGCPQFSSRPWA